MADKRETKTSRATAPDRPSQAEATPAVDTAGQIRDWTVDKTGWIGGAFVEKGATVQLTDRAARYENVSQVQ